VKAIMSSAPAWNVRRVLSTGRADTPRWKLAEWRYESRTHHEMLAALDECDEERH
jgi:hypothetical protein